MVISHWAEKRDGLGQVWKKFAGGIQRLRTRGSKNSSLSTLYDKIESGSGFGFVPILAELHTVELGHHLQVSFPQFFFKNPLMFGVRVFMELSWLSRVFFLVGHGGLLRSVGDFPNASIQNKSNLNTKFTGF